LFCILFCSCPPLTSSAYCTIARNLDHPKSLIPAHVRPPLHHVTSHSFANACRPDQLDIQTSCWDIAQHIRTVHCDPFSFPVVLGRLDPERRYLQRTTMTSWYLEFTTTWWVLWKATIDACCAGRRRMSEQPPSFRTFCHNYFSKWARLLPMRKVSDHAQCSFCWQCQHEMRNSKLGLGPRRDAMQKLHDHRISQYLDRQRWP
jgi:hypothetical protein